MNLRSRYFHKKNTDFHHLVEDLYPSILKVSKKTVSLWKNDEWKVIDKLNNL